MTASNRTKIRLPASIRHPGLWIIALIAIMTMGCNLTKQGETESVISFDRIVDSLKQFDKVSITLKGLNGDTLDVVFQGKVESASDIQKLKAPHWDGGKVIISITGVKNGKVVYQVDTRLDPATNLHDGVVVFVSSDVSLLCSVQNLTLLMGDSL